MVESLIPREPDTRPETTTDRLLEVLVGIAYTLVMIGWWWLIFNMPRVFGP
jgi:hypothetical protein